MIVRLALTVLLCLSGLDAALAAPARIIILRHGEKATAYKLCDIGRERAEALTTTYLGRGAAKSLFASGEAPVRIDPTSSSPKASCERAAGPYMTMRSRPTQF